MKSPQIIFGLRDLPTPPRMGYLFYRFPAKLGMFDERTLMVIDLYNTDEQYLSDIFRKGIEKLLKQKNFLEKGAVPTLENYETENMEEFARVIFDRIINEFY
jgi:hypothetical protein